MAEFADLFEKSKLLIDNARETMGVLVNSITVYTSFLLGKYMVEEEQQGADRAKYGAKILDSLSSYLTKEYGRGFSRTNLSGMRKFYLVYRDRDEKIIQSSIGQLRLLQENGIVQSPIGQLSIDRQNFPFQLSWTHYQVLMTIENPEERSFYEQAAISESWNVQTLKRQYHSSLYERLALSKDKDAVMEMSRSGTTPYRPADILKSPLHLTTKTFIVTWSYMIGFCVAMF